MRGWSVLGSVLLMGSGALVLVSPRGSLDSLDSLFALFP